MKEIIEQEPVQNVEHMTQIEVEKYLLDLLDKKESPNFSVLVDYLHKILPWSVNDSSRDENGETNWDKVYKALPTIYNHNAQLGQEIENIVGQDGQMISTKSFLGTIFEEYCKDETSYFFSNAIHSLNYVYSFGRDEQFNAYFEKNLDFENKENFDRTAKMLDFLSKLFNVGIGNNSWSKTHYFINDLLSNIIANGSGSYFLQIKAQELKASIDNSLKSENYINTRETFNDDESNSSYMLRPQMRRIVNSEFSMEIEKLSGVEQSYFLEFIKSKPANDIENVKNFVKEYGSDGLRTFLSLQHNNKLGDKLVEFGNNTDKNVVHEVFRKYSEIIDASNNVLEYLKKEFDNNKEYTPEILSEISEKLSKEGCSVLEKFITEADTSKGLVDIEKLQALLETIKTDTIAFLSAFKALKSTDSEFSLGDVQNLDLTTTPFTEISKEDVAKMESMYKANYAKYPKLAEFLTHKFEEAMQQKDGSMSILRRKGEIVAFYRLGPTEKENVLYFGSFNVDPTYQGALLGETLMQESLDAKSKDNIVVAECNPQVSVSANYIERGFIGFRKDHIEEIDILRIVRNDKKNKSLLSRNVSREDLINGVIKDPQVHVYSFPNEKLSEFDFSIVGNKNGNMTEVLTRYFKNKETGMTYIVTEDVTDDFLDQYSVPSPN